MGGPGYVDGQPRPETDNFGICRFQNDDGVVFINAEQYFQWCKCVNDDDRQRVLETQDGWRAWSVGNHVVLRHDWEVVKVRCMMDGNRLKFAQNADLRDALISTSGHVQFGEYFWGTWNGRIMEYLRAEFRNGGQEDEETMQSIMGLLEEYEAEERAKLAPQEED